MSVYSSKLPSLKDKIVEVPEPPKVEKKPKKKK